MILNLCSLAFNLNVDGGGATPAWGTEMGQGEGYKFAFEDMDDFFTGMVYNAVPDVEEVTCPLGKGGNQRGDYDFVIASIFKKVFVNGVKVDGARFLALIVKKINGDHHVGRRTLKYNPRMTYRQEYINQDCYDKIAVTLGITSDAGWFVHEIIVNNQDEIHFTVIVIDENKPKNYPSNNERKAHLESLLPKGEGRKRLIQSSSSDKQENLQTIYYGAPGTGKSHEVKKITGELDADGNDVEMDNVFRTTFHPDTDYATFVGCYKPVMKETGQQRKVNGKSEEIEEISYEFIPQAFTDAYVYAYTHPEETTYLVIEEINRGNCAQIFGDLFQLLDRNSSGSSEYAIKPDKDLAKYLAKELYNNEVQADSIKLSLPSNLHILATMNTSDQSLFPMDSAFKRRWDWEYVAICYKEPHSSAFEIDIEGKKYSWVEFIQKVNAKIFDLTKSEDKEMGNFFIKSSIDAKLFKSKVMFYLWNEVLRDEVDNGKYFFYYKDGNENKAFTFKRLYEPDATDVLKGFMAYLGFKDSEEE